MRPPLAFRFVVSLIVPGGEGEIRGYVPEGLVMEMLGIARRPGHGEVYAWLEKHGKAVEAAVKTRNTGGVPKAPFDRIDIAEKF